MQLKKNKLAPKKVLFQTSLQGLLLWRYCQLVASQIK